ncbi:hypothetical protein GWI33_020612 [Rhynchophorus ferrugineus]|uniref:Uncharacterized protein n=1 Tax=Rhynchophorus ferrugineus TaxID=354439 RepID=A0A834LZA8_RHYFE|nr:hypothetical protein GWI33_020612 [Rhynchophorus ferrugineus]
MDDNKRPPDQIPPPSAPPRHGKARKVTENGHVSTPAVAITELSTIAIRNEKYAGGRKRIRPASVIETGPVCADIDFLVIYIRTVGEGFRNNVASGLLLAPQSVATLQLTNEDAAGSRHVILIGPLETCQKGVFGDIVVSCVNSEVAPDVRQSISHQLDFSIRMYEQNNRKPIKPRRTQSFDLAIEKQSPELLKRRTSDLLDELLVQIYNSTNNTTDYYSTSGKSQRSAPIDVINLHERGYYRDEMRMSLSMRLVMCTIDVKTVMTDAQAI